MLQSHSFRAICALNAGDSAAARALILRCVEVHGFRSGDLAAADSKATRKLRELADTLRETVAAAPRYDGSGQRWLPGGSGAYRIDLPATARQDSWYPAERAAAAAGPDGASGDRASSSSGSSRYHDANGATSQTGSDGSEAYHDARSRGETPSSRPSTSGASADATRPQSRQKGRKAHGVELQYDASETVDDFARFHEAELVTRLQAHLVARGHSITDVMEMLRMRMMELHMAVRSPLLL